MARSADGRDNDTKGPRSDDREELWQLVRSTRALAEQARSELAQFRRQNELLHRRLERTDQELLELRREVAHLLAERASQAGTPLRDAKPDPVETGVPEFSQASRTIPSQADTTARLADMQDQIAINTAQIREQAQTKVESDSRFRVRLFGTLLSNTYWNTSDSSDAASPFAAPPPYGDGAYEGGNLGATFRQTSFGFAMTGPKVGDAGLSAEVDFDFYGERTGVYGRDVLGALRMRTASVRLDAPKTSLAVGLVAPMIAPLNPTSLAAVYYPAMSESGNLWQWRPQVVMERRVPVKESGNLILQGGLTLPFGETLEGYALRGRPGFETRVAFLRRLDADRRLEFGAGGYLHRQPFGFDRAVSSYALTGDWSIPLNDRLEFIGETYFGRGNDLIGKSGSDLAYAFAANGPLYNPLTEVWGIHSWGGWGQLRVRTTPGLDFNIAFGVDDPRNHDVLEGITTGGTRLKNQSVSVNSIFRLRSNFMFSAEYRHLWTTYPTARTTNGHVNLAVGYSF